MPLPAREPEVQSATKARRVLLTGASGYVGGQLLRALERRGDLVVRCLARDPARLPKPANPRTEVEKGDVFEGISLYRALRDVEVAYYLIHTMNSDADFEQQDRLAAQIFGHAARVAGVRRIIYLGGLGDDRERLSPHLRSRQEVGRVLRDSGVECIEFRASLVIGKGSLSFELVRSLTHRLPIMICPRWLNTPTQPIGIDDILAYLLAALDLPPGPSRVYEVGGQDVVSYGDIIRLYAEVRGLRRLLIPLPVLTPYLSSLWLRLVTPATAAVGRHLIEGLRNPTVVRDRAALEDFSIRPVGIREAIERALRETA
jgi:uncharacterized protein YbjT (DUF2867 family)